MSTLEIYCDGGCRGNQSSNNIGAWGVYMTHKGHSKEICGGARNTTNNQMELRAVIEALKAVKIKNLETNVYLDSAYVLNGITQWVHGWERNGWLTSKKKPVENMELWKELVALKNEFPFITFHKVKGHSDNEGNNRADMLCNLEMNRLQNEDDEEWLEYMGFKN